MKNVKRRLLVIGSTIFIIGVFFAVIWTTVINFKEYWVLFWGSVAGGVITLIGVFLTINYYKKQDLKKFEESIKPYLILRTSGYNEKRVIKHSMIEKGEGKLLVYNIKNIGNGTALIRYICINPKLNTNDFILPDGTSSYIEKNDNITFKLIIPAEMKSIGIVVVYNSIGSFKYKRKFMFLNEGDKWTLFPHTKRLEPISKAFAKRDYDKDEEFQDQRKSLKLL